MNKFYELRNYINSYLLDNLFENSKINYSKTIYALLQITWLSFLLVISWISLIYLISLLKYLITWDIIIMQFLNIWLSFIFISAIITIVIFWYIFLLFSLFKGFIKQWFKIYNKNNLLFLLFIFITNIIILFNNFYI